mgnify:CR=1 FL=1
MAKISDFRRFIEYRHYKQVPFNWPFFTAWSEVSNYDMSSSYLCPVIMPAPPIIYASLPSPVVYAPHPVIYALVRCSCV